ncbi:MAG: hypothetical protein WA775_07095 [Psychroserpens sp.]|uniref:hypothetical protein n=1 Tax=Psychroserpens sp. TaxID=2020870 RepID=UPI003C915C60
MKNTMYIILLLLFPLWGLGGCNEDDDHCQGIDCLPPATQTGEGTFGCLVNGKPFVDNSGSFNCFYQLVDGEYYFGIRGRQDSVIDQIGIGSEKKNIETNINLFLKSQQDGNFYGRVSFNCSNCMGATTTEESLGLIKFTLLDFENNIVSAIFEFTVTDPNNGKVYEITEGRFDAQFTQ